MKAINIILDCRDAQNPIFVEIETDEGKSVDVGNSIQVGHMRKIRITPETFS